MYLQSIKDGHDKVKTNVYDNLKNPQNYITSKILTNIEKSILFGLRSETIRGIKMNFSNMYSDNNLCPICERSPDSQEHLPLCPVLQSILPLEKHIEYSHIHGSVEQQKEYVEVYKQYLEIRDELMDSSGGPCLPGPYAGPLRPQAARRS